MHEVELFLCGLLWSAAVFKTQGSMNHPLAPARCDLAGWLFHYTPAANWPYWED